MRHTVARRERDAHTQRHSARADIGLMTQQCGCCATFLWSPPPLSSALPPPPASLLQPFIIFSLNVEPGLTGQYSCVLLHLCIDVHKERIHFPLAAFFQARINSEPELNGVGIVNWCTRYIKVHFLATMKVVLLTHSFLNAKHLFPGFFTYFYAIFEFLRLEHECYAKLTSCST